MRGRAAYLGLILACVAAAAPATAQLGYFGQNKVHYRNFDWQVLKGEHIDLYFYPEERELASLALAYAEESFSVLERKFGHTPHRRIPLIIYALHTDFEQTNILEFIPPEGILGVTEYLKRRVAVPFNGNYSEFRHTLRHEIVHAFQLSVLTDVRVRFRMRLPPIPLWWSEGLAELWSGGEDALDHSVLRDLTVSGRMPRLRQLALIYGAVVYPIGGAIHRWLADEYGDWRVQVLYRDLWKYRNFDEALAAVYGQPIEELEEQVHFQFQQRYFPEVTDRRPLNVGAERLADVAIKPVAFRLPEDSITRYLYLSPRTGHMNIYSGVWFAPGAGSVEVKGQRTEQFESFHSSASRLDVRDGVVVFSSKFLDRDALFFWDLRSRRVVGRYQFPELVSMLSPTWAPDGRSVVFSGLTQSGFSDLYRLWIEEERLERLTSDRYQDTDPSFSPDGSSLVFVSDRTAYGPDGALNLFVLDVAGEGVRYLTYGPWRDEAPRWSEDGKIYFTSDRLGVTDVYRVNPDGQGQRVTNTLTGLFDPQWIPGENALLFSGFNELSFHVFRSPLDPGVGENGERFTLPETVDTAVWHWPELVESPYSRVRSVPYEPGLSLDWALGDALLAPGIGSAQGLVFQFSDMLSDHLLYLTAYSYQGKDLGSFAKNINATAFYLNRTSRLNWGAGLFRLRGYFYVGNYQTVYEETSYGGFADLRWPLSRFKRIDAQLRIEYSDRFDIAGIFEGDPHRVGWLVSNYASYVHDNTLWLASGPIDGSRTNISTGITNDLTNGRFDSWMVSFDHRQYRRFGLDVALATRLQGYYSGGSRPRRISIGGTWGLRGYPRIGNVGGTRTVLVNNELRFPLTRHITLGFPFGDMRFPGVQGALFVDLGGAWVPNSIGRSVLGSTGFGFRLPLGYVVVLRLDMGWRFAFGETYGYSIPPPEDGRWFVDFFFGFNY